MRLASMSSVTPAPHARAQQASSHGRDVFRRHTRDLLSLPGALSARWSATAPDQIQVRFSTDGFRRLADNVLRDAVDGVRLLLTTAADAPGSNPADDVWVHSPSEMAKAVAGMPGVVDALADHEHGVRTYRLTTATQADNERLRQLVNPMLGNYHAFFFTARG